MTAQSATATSIVEVFASAQGEGPEIGRTTVFVRFGGCDLRCGWCDSPGTWRPTANCRIERAPFSERFIELANPVETVQIADWVDALAANASTWVSLTGGEPLLQPDQVEALVAELVLRGRRIYLETHGLHAAALERVVDRIDLVSMDWKLESDVRWAPRVEKPADEDFGQAHERFLRVALRAKAAYVKLVLTPNTRSDEFDAMLDRIERVEPNVPLVLQPVTPTGSVQVMPTARELLAWLARAEARLPDVRLIPQTHRVYGAL